MLSISTKFPIFLKTRLPFMFFAGGSRKCYYPILHIPLYLHLRTAAKTKKLQGVFAFFENFTLAFIATVCANFSGSGKLASENHAIRASLKTDHSLLYVKKSVTARLHFCHHADSFWQSGWFITLMLLIQSRNMLADSGKATATVALITSCNRISRYSI